MITEFPLFLFTVLTSTAAGLYVGAALFPRTSKEERPWLFPVVVLVLAALGGLSAMAHLGRPQNVLNVLYNPTSSLTMEGIATGCLALVAFIDAIMSAKQKSNRAVKIVGALAAIFLLCTITYEYVSCYGDVAWSAAPSYVVFILVGLASGMGVWYAWCGEANKNEAIAVGVIAALAGVVLLWQGGVFMGLEADGAPLIFVGAVVELAAAVVAFMCATDKLTAALRYKIVAILAVVALIVSRYGFYMASII